jgi:hypothetical protein
MQAIFDLIEKVGISKLDELIEQGDGLRSLEFLREMIFEKKF